ncbi:non-specific lipid-transfer protein 1-like [Eucalyptus grandis]|uniref:non-specific lipid-transfer protein 1-like n=1 Tax=Eucalyptus grandis TaxID=71139 RepID=UPI00192F1109|nr:non-specific lipid-transfer protein 1-like [Eucalyptus grandis]
MAVAVAPVARAAVTCSQAPCIPYMRSDMGPMPASCCNGFKSLDSAAQTMPDCQATCECLKPVSGSISDLNYGVVAGLPEKCGVSIPYKISPGTNCSKSLSFFWTRCGLKGEACKIVCTQPQRISATSVAERTSSERGENVGDDIRNKAVSMT